MPGPLTLSYIPVMNYSPEHSGATRRTEAPVVSVDASTPFRHLPRIDELTRRLQNLASSLHDSIKDDPQTDGIVHALERRDYDSLCELGIDTTYVWLDALAVALTEGTPFVQIEAISPYASSCVDPDGTIRVSWDRLPADERTGIMVASALREVFYDCENIRYSALLDDFHKDGTVGDPGVFTEQQQDQYIVQMTQLLHEQGVLLPTDIPGKHYVLTRERELHAYVDPVIDRLRFCGRGDVETTDNGDVIFRPSPSLIRRLALYSENRKREFARNGILLRRNGRPTCAALDAAGFVNSTTNDVQHVLILDKWLTSQQDKTYALLRAMSVVTQDRYDNIFFDSATLSPQLITYALCVVLQQQFETQAELARRDQAWRALNAFTKPLP